VQHLGHDKGVDWWTLGILIFEFLTGDTPFKGVTTMAMYDSIVSGKLTYPPGFPADAKAVVSALLETKSAHRLGNLKNDAGDVKAMPWFADISWEGLYDEKLKVRRRSALAPSRLVLIPGTSHRALRVHSPAPNRPCASRFGGRLHTCRSCRPRRSSSRSTDRVRASSIRWSS
jgi:serine/threonine protein kinase